MKKLVLSLAMAFAVVSGLAFLASDKLDTVFAPVVVYAQSASEADLQAQIEELRLLIQLLLANQAQPAATPAPAVPVPVAPTPTLTAPTPAATPGLSHSHTRANRPTNPAISLDRAIEIGYAELARRGHVGTFRSHSGMDWERNQWVWEIEFRVPAGGRRPIVEMYINVDTGAIVKFEWDD